MAIQGLRDTSNFVADQRPKNWREGILLLTPNGSAPLYALTSLMKKKTTDDPEYHWWDKLQPSQRVTLGANLTTGATSLTLTTGASQLKDGHLLYVEQSGEIMLVNGDPANETAVNVVRAYSGTTATTSVAYDANNINPNLTVIGSAYEEGSQSPTGINYDPTKRTNYTQIFRNNLEATRTASKTRLRTGDAVREARRECLELHSMEIERAFWFGGASETVRNGKPLRTTGGVHEVIPSANITTASATTNLATFEGYMKNWFAFGSSEKMVFTGNTGMLVIQQICRRNSSYQLMQGQKEFGMNVSRLVSPFGELILKTHPLFNRMTGGSPATATGVYAGLDAWVWVLDMENFTFRNFQGDDTRWIPDQQENGLDGMKAGYLSEIGLEIHHPSTHHLLKGLTAAAADS